MNCMVTEIPQYHRGQKVSVLLNDLNICSFCGGARVYLNICSLCGGAGDYFNICSLCGGVRDDFNICSLCGGARDDLASRE